VSDTLNRKHSPLDIRTLCNYDDEAIEATELVSLFFSHCFGRIWKLTVFTTF